MKSVRVSIVDDDPTVAAVVGAALEAAGYEVKSYGTSTDFLNSGTTDGILLLDNFLPDIDGLELQAVLKQRECPIAIIFLTIADDASTARQALKSGAFDYIEKPARSSDVVAAVGRVAELERQYARQRERVTKAETLLGELSARERQVFLLIADGMSNKGIADMLHISEHTVKSHRARVMEKTKAASVADLVRLHMVAKNG